MGKKKKFDKNNSTKFVLLDRSWTDQQQANSDVTPYVLVPAISFNDVRRQRKKNKGKKNEDKLDLKKDTPQVLKDHITPMGFPNDGYDYEQHLRPIGGGKFISVTGEVINLENEMLARVQLPEEVLPGVELSKKFEAITISEVFMDDDLRDALDESLNKGEFEELDDDFVMQAMKEDDSQPDFDFKAHIQNLIRQSERNINPLPKKKIQEKKDDDEEEDGDEEDDDDEEEEEEDEDEEEDDDDDDDEEDDDVDVEEDEEDDGEEKKENEDEEKEDDNQEKDKNKDNKTKKIKKSQKPIKEMNVYEEMFEQVLKGYGSDDIGELDEDDAELEDGFDLKAKFVDNIMNEFIQSQKKKKLISEQMSEEDKKRIKEFYIKKINEEEDDEEDDDKRLESHVYFQKTEKEKWDCESILSTRSTSENLPKVITIQSLQKKTKKKTNSDISNQKSEKTIIELSKKTGLPIGVLDSNKNLNEEELPVSSGMNKGKPRDRNETKEEKKARKEMAKIEKQQNRTKKKEIKNIFKNEEQRQLKSVSGTQVGGNVSVFRFS